MNDKSFCLRWNKYSDVFFDTFAYLWKSQDLADVTLFCDGRQIRCHRLVLCACSSYFQSMLSTNWQPNSTIFLCHIRFEDLEALIEFIYTGVVTVGQDRLASVVKAGEALKIKGLGESDSESEQNVNDSKNLQTDERKTTQLKPQTDERKATQTAVRNNIPGEVAVFDAERPKRRRTEYSDVYSPVTPVVGEAPKSVVSSVVDTTQGTSEQRDSLEEEIEEVTGIFVKEEYKDMVVGTSEMLSVSEQTVEQSSSSFSELTSNYAERSFEADGEFYIPPARTRVTNQGRWKQMIFAALWSIAVIGKRKPTMERLSHVFRTNGVEFDASAIDAIIQEEIVGGRMKMKIDKYNAFYFRFTVQGRQYAEECYKMLSSFCTKGYSSLSFEPCQNKKKE